MLSTNHLDQVSEAFADRLAQDPDYRILRRLPRPSAWMPTNGAPPDGQCLALVDLETTSLHSESGAIIEIAIKLLWVSDDGDLLGHLPVFSWLEDPGQPLDPQIIQLTGLKDKDLAEKRIDDEAVVRLLDRADLIIAHNAKFDAPWIERRWPELSGRQWACSCQEIDWLGLGFEGRSQPFLLQQHGWFTQAHRAGDDVWSLFWLLQQGQHRPTPSGQDQQHGVAGTVMTTHLQSLLEASARPGMRIEAIGIPFSKKDLLAQRGYRWDSRANRRFWWREVDPTEAHAERLWFSRSNLPAPRCVLVGACERHR